MHRTSLSNSNRSRCIDTRQRIFVLAIATLVVTFALSLVPTPLYLIAPGNAVDLSRRVIVDGRPLPRRRLYLTDVTVARASVLLLAARLWPGVRLVRRETIVPAGVSARGFDRAMNDAMGESQNNAAIVAERAAGYHVAEPHRRVVIVDLIPTSRANGVLALGDALSAIDGHPVRRLGDVARNVHGVVPGTRVSVTYERDGRTRTSNVTAIRGPRGARLGILAEERTSPAALPVPVHYDVGDIAGSSGGLMFALEIYARLKSTTGSAPVAGTGTISEDGRIGPIEGVRQKAIAAERIGIKLFLVPRENYAEAAEDRAITVIPVTTFQEALAALKTTRTKPTRTAGLLRNRLRFKPPPTPNPGPGSPGPGANGGPSPPRFQPAAGLSDRTTQKPPKTEP